MSVRDTITSDIKEAMKSRDELRLSVLRMAQASFHNKEIEKKGRGEEFALSDEEIIAVLRSEVKKRKDAAEGFRKGGRVESAEKEEQELKIIEAYLPAEMPDGELEAIVTAVLKEAGAVSQKDFGAVMGKVMQKVAGRASGGRVSAILKKALTVP